MARIPKKIICLATASVIICAHVPVAHAEALPNVLEGSATLADNIMSYYALSGSAVANTDWINTLYDSYGSSFGTIYDLAENGMLTLNNDGTWQATTALETAIENAPAYQSLGLDQIFNVSAQEAAAGGGIAASGAATLAGSLAGVASTGVLTLFGGVTAAYWGGIAIGTLIAHKLGLYGKNIDTGMSITEQLSLIPNGSGILSRSKYNSSISIDYYFNGSSEIVPVAQFQRNGGDFEGDVYILRIFNYGYSAEPYYELDGNRYVEKSLSAESASSTYASYHGYTGNATIVDNNLSISEIIAGFRNGTYQKKKPVSPDMIGQNGNLEGDYNEENGYSVPDMKPQVDPGVQSGKPLTLQDWLNFANSVTNNNSNTNPLPDNKALFDDLINAIKKDIPNPNSNPDPNPDPDPDPDPDPYHPPTPTPVPDPDYGDPNPDQPDFESETDIPDPVDTGNPWVTPDLLDKFPFCIPKDMIDMAKGFKSADRTAPHISWNFKSPVGHVDYTFNLDLEDFEDVATLLRALELAAFIVGLAFATRYLIGAS